MRRSREQVANVLKVRPKPVVARGAWGDVGSVPLPFSFGWDPNEVTLAHQLEHRWFGLFGQGAISKHRPYDRSRAGVAYVMKCLNEGTWGANDYELRKFNLADTVTLSRSVFRVNRNLDRMGVDATARTCERDGLLMKKPTGSAGLDQPPARYAEKPVCGWANPSNSELVARNCVSSPLEAPSRRRCASRSWLNSPTNSAGLPARRPPQISLGVCRNVSLNQLDFRQTTPWYRHRAWGLDDMKTPVPFEGFPSSSV